MTNFDNIIVFTDTDTDITPVEAKKYGFKLISMPYSIDDKEVRPYIDFEEFQAHEFYDLLRSGVLPKTYGLSPQTYIDYFEPYFKEGKDILYIHFSKAMSGTFNAMNLAIEELQEKYPERKIYTCDTFGITTNANLLVKELGDLILEGKSLEEVIEYCENERQHIATYFFADDLKFFKASGRVKGFAAFMGGLIGIKPILFFDSDGMMGPKGKIRGTGAAIEKLINYMEELQDHIKDHRIIIANCDAPNLVEKIIVKIKEKFGEDCNIEIVDVNPTAGAHCGPNAAGVAFHAIHR